MSRIKEFRQIMIFAGQIAQRQNVAVSLEHIVFAFAAINSKNTLVSRAIIEYGTGRGWPVRPEPTTLLQFLSIRRPKIDPRLQQEIEQSVREGSPDVRAMLLTCADCKELTQLRDSIESAGGSLHEWLVQGSG